MELIFTQEGIRLDKELNDLDHLALDFIALLNKHKVRYVLISGYVAILLGRSRGSEDIDFFIEPQEEKHFQAWWQDVSREFECINTSSEHEAFHEYLQKETAIRFARGGQFIPNVEVKYPKGSLEQWSLNHAQRVMLNGQAIMISRLESQIPFKLVLGSEKDIEDARYLYQLCKEHLEKDLFDAFIRKFKIEQAAKRYLGWNYQTST